MNMCSIDGCVRVKRTRGWCDPHYKRWLRTGDPNGQQRLRRRPGQSVRDWFWSEVRWAGQCWERPGSRDALGRDRVTVDGRKMLASRAAWMWVFGDPGDRDVLHRCDNPTCVRPDHLFLGDQALNMADKVAKGRQTRGASNSGAKLTAETVRDIRRRYADGSLQRLLAAEYGVTESLVSMVASRRIWKHVV